MKTFLALREKKSKGMPPGEHVSSTRVNKHSVMVHQDKRGFTVYIDGDKLDTFKNQKEAEKAGKEFAKEF